jgi:AraC-like DNA-binding protein
MGLMMTTNSKEPIICNSTLPASLSDHYIADANIFCSTGDYGTLIFQEIAGVDFSIWYCEYLIVQNTTLYGYGEESALELHFTLNHEQICTLDGLGKVIVPAWQYNLTYLPYIQNKAEFRKGGMCTTFDIHFSMDYLCRLSPYVPALGKFLEQVDQGIASSLAPHAAVASPRMMEIINKILYCEYTGAVKSIFLESKVQELLILGFEMITSQVYVPAGITLRPDDVDRLQEARNWLIQNMDEPCSLKSLARAVFINEFKLKKGFKQLFGCTVFDFLIEIRMEKARLLLMTMDIPIREIAMMTGYKSIPNFTAAFKRKFGQPPSMLKKKQVA